MADLLANGIDVYPQKEFDEDSEDRLVNEKFRVSAWCCGLDVFGWVLQLWVLVISWGGSCAKCLYFLSKLLCPCPEGLPRTWVLGSTQDQGSCQSSEQRQKEGEESTWGGCPLLSMLLLFTPAQFLKGTLGNQRAGRSHGPLPCPRHREYWCQPIPG